MVFGNATGGAADSLKAALTLDVSGFEAGVNRAASSTETLKSKLSAAQSSFKEMRPGLSAAAAGANAFTAALGGTASKITTFAAAASGAFAAGGPIVAGVTVAIGALTFLAGKFWEARDAAVASATESAGAFDKEAEAIRGVTTELEKQAKLQGRKVAGLSDADLTTLGDRESARANVEAARGRALGAQSAFESLQADRARYPKIQTPFGELTRGPSQADVDAAESKARATVDDFAQLAKAFTSKFGEVVDGIDDSVTAAAQDVDKVYGSGGNNALKLGASQADAAGLGVAPTQLKTGGGRIVGTNLRTGFGGTLEEIKKSQEAIDLENAKAALISQEIGLMGQLRASHQQEQEQFIAGQQEAIKSYEDLLVAGDKEAEHRLARDRQADAYREARGKGYLSEDQLRAALAKLGADFDKHEKEIAQKAEESFAVAGLNAASAFGQSIKSYFEGGEGDPSVLFKGLLQGLGAILSVIPGFQVAGAGFNVLAGFLHGGGPTDWRQAHGGTPVGPRLRSDEVMIKAQTGEGILSRAGRASMSDAELDYRNRTGRAPGGGGGGTTIVYAPSLDQPDFSAFAPRTAEPVFKRRLDDRRAGMYRRSLERAVRPRRAS